MKPPKSENVTSTANLHLTNSGLDEVISHKRSQLTEVRAKSVSLELPDAQYWFAKFPLKALFVAQVHLNSITWLIVRRAHDSVEDYEEACTLLAQAVADRGSTNYFRALRRFENCIGYIYQSRQLWKNAGLPQFFHLFQPNDGSVFQRLNHLYNVGRHHDPSKLPNGYLHALWLANDGVYGVDESGDETSVSFEELRAQVLELGQFAQKIVDGTLH